MEIVFLQQQELGQYYKQKPKICSALFAALLSCLIGLLQQHPLKGIFTIMGYIIKNRQIAIGIETLYIERILSLKAILGVNFPMPIPAPIQSKTQPVRYFSKMDNFLCLVIFCLIVFSP